MARLNVTERLIGDCWEMTVKDCSTKAPTQRDYGEGPRHTLPPLVAHSLPFACVSASFLSDVSSFAPFEGEFPVIKCR